MDYVPTDAATGLTIPDGPEAVALLVAPVHGSPRDHGGPNSTHEALSLPVRGEVRNGRFVADDGVARTTTLAMLGVRPSAMTWEAPPEFAVPSARISALLGNETRVRPEAAFFSRATWERLLPPGEAPGADVAEVMATLDADRAGEPKGHADRILRYERAALGLHAKLGHDLGACSLSRLFTHVAGWSPFSRHFAAWLTESGQWRRMSELGEDRETFAEVLSLLAEGNRLSAGLARHGRRLAPSSRMPALIDNSLDVAALALTTAAEAVRERPSGLSSPPQASAASLAEARQAVARLAAVNADVGERLAALASALDAAVQDAEEWEGIFRP